MDGEVGGIQPRYSMSWPREYTSLCTALTKAWCCNLWRSKEEFWDVPATIGAHLSSVSEAGIQSNNLYMRDSYEGIQSNNFM